MGSKFLRLQQLKEKTIVKIADKGSDVFLKRAGITKEITRDNVIKAIKVSLKVMDSPMGNIYGIDKMRADVIRGMENECCQLLKSGETKENVFNFYWGIPEFQIIWVKLGMDDNNLRVLIDKLIVVE